MCHGSRRLIAILLGLFAAIGGEGARGRTLRRIEHLAHLRHRHGTAEPRAAYDLLEREIVRANATGSFAVLSFDLDGFKAVNDMHGHAAGDRVLTLVASARVPACVPRTRWKAGRRRIPRILPGATLEGATVAAEKLRQALQEPIRSATLRPLSASIGASFYPTQGQIGALQKAADDASTKRSARARTARRRERRENRRG
jgi:diguanylate cyclase (GGDEF)-like protein